MATVVKYVCLGGLTFGGILYGRLYLDVIMAQSAVKSIDREVNVAHTERENIKHEISSNKKVLVDLESKGSAKLKEQSVIQQRVSETTSLLSRLKNELAQSKNEFEKLQSRMKETSMKVEKLQLIDAQKKQLIEGASGRRKSAVQEVNKARAAMELHNLPLMGSLFSKK